MTFIDMCSDLGSSIVLVPIIGVLGNVAIAKAFGMYAMSSVVKLIVLFYLLCRIVSASLIMVIL